MKLYMHPVSTTCRSILLFLADEGLSVDLEVVDLMKGEQYGESFLKLNPSHQVPVLKDGSFTLTESASILRYIAQKTESKLFPKDLQAQAKVNEAMDWFNTNFYREYGYNLTYPQVFDHHKRSSESATEAVVKWGAEKSNAWLKILNDNILGPDNLYLVNNEKTIADYFGAGLLTVGEVIGVDLGDYPNVQRWFANMKESPNWNKVCEAHNGFVQSVADQKFIGLN